MIIPLRSLRIASTVTAILMCGASLTACSLSSPSESDSTSDSSKLSDDSAPDVASEDSVAASDASPSPPIAISIQALPDDHNYRFCSEPLSSGSDLGQGELQTDPSVTGLCFAFRKEGDRVIGSYYDTATLGEVGLCVSGMASGNTILGKGREFIGSVGRQTLIDGSMGSELVNWDEQGFLKVAQAEIVNQSDVGTTEVLYSSAKLDLTDFYRYPNSEVANDCPDLQIEE